MLEDAEGTEDTEFFNTEPMEVTEGNNREM